MTIFSLKWLFAVLLCLQFLALIPRLHDGNLFPERTGDALSRLRKALRQVAPSSATGVISGLPAPAALRTTFDKLDVNRDGVISWEEFTQQNVDGFDLRVGGARAPSSVHSKAGAMQMTSLSPGRQPETSPGPRTHAPGPLPAAPARRVERGRESARGINCGAIINLATTFIEQSADPAKVAAQEAVLKNYQRLRETGGFQGFLFTTNATWANRARAHGVVVLSEVETNAHGTPKLKPMFHKMMELSQKECGAPEGIVFDGYANGDIVFAQSMLSTLVTLRRGWARSIANGTKKGVLLVGRRTNINYKGEEIAGDDALLRFAVTRGKIIASWAEDYFIYSRSAAGSAADWGEVPDFVVGRLAYDNWLVDHAYHDVRTDLVDGTETVLAVHLTAKDGNYAGHSKGSDTHWNKGLLNPVTGKSIGQEFSHGKTHHCPFATKFIHQGNTSRGSGPQIALSVRHDAGKGRSLPPEVLAVAPAAHELPTGELEAKKIYDLGALRSLADTFRLGAWRRRRRSLRR